MPDSTNPIEFVLIYISLDLLNRIFFLLFLSLSLKITHCIFAEHFGDKDKQNFLLELSVKYFPFGPDSSFIHLFLAPRLLPRRLFVYCRPTIHSKGPLFAYPC